MNLQKLSEPLSIDQIDFRVQSINKGGYATILAYKDARVDMQRLDDAVGPLNWKREHKNDNHNCVVSIYNKEIGEWVSKEDTGTESNTEAEKGLASDSFKRACFNWGIGRELYEYPAISIKLNADEFEIKEFNGKQKAQQTWNLKLKEWVWLSEFDEAGKIVLLAAFDEKACKRYEWKKNAEGGQKTAKVMEKNKHAKELIDLLIEGHDEEACKFWRSLGLNDQQTTWKELDKETQKHLKNILSQNVVTK